MFRTHNGLILLALICCFASLAPLSAAPVSWVNWTSGTSGAGGSASGVLDFDGVTVNVSYTGEIAFIQTSGGANYWNPSVPYTSALVDNAPPAADIIALSSASSKTLTFSKPVSDLLFAVVSLNGNGYRFNQDFEILSYGCGYWGCGTLTKQDLGGGVYQLNGSGEPHGVIRFTGVVSSITWTSLTNEYWNGFTVGTFGVIIDTTPPETSIVSGPAEGASIPQTTATISFSGSDNLSVTSKLRYQWRLDGGAWSALSTSTSIPLSSLAEGSHTFEVAAKDEQDNIDPTPATRTFTVDTTPPVISTVESVPSLISCQVSWSTNEPATSSVEYGLTSAYGSMTLLDAALVTSRSVNIPNLAPATQYHYRVRSADAAGNETVSDDASFTTVPDTTPPDTQITSGVAEGAKSMAPDITFTWSGSDDATPADLLVFSYRLDAAAWSAYSVETSHLFTRLTPGHHTLEVRAKDASGNEDPSPAVRHFVSTRADQWASAVVDVSSECPPAPYPDWAWTAEQALGEPNTFDYGDHMASWAPSSRSGTREFITVSFEKPVYADGVTVRETWGNGFVYQIDALDLAGVLHQVWTGTDPSQPGQPVDNLIVWPQTNYKVKGIKVYTDTDHNLSTWEEIDAIQLHGAVNALEPDSISPDTQITSGPVEGARIPATDVTFTWSGTDDISFTVDLVYSFRLDGGAWSALSTSTSIPLSSLAEGSHTFEVAAKDEHDNIDSTPATRTFTVDTTPPTVISTSPADSAVDVNISPVITATFSEAMDPATINASTFLLKDAGNTAVAGTVVYENTTHVATFTPSVPLSYNASYTCVITTAARDAAGNALASNHTWSFSTPPDVLVSQGLGASAYYASSTWDPSHQPFQAFDGGWDTGWNAGSWPTQWIEFDLANRHQLDRFVLQVNQFPAGHTEHQILVSDSPIQSNPAGATVAHTFSGNTTDAQILEVALVTPVLGRFVQVRTTSSPSYVAWYEIQAYALRDAGKPSTHIVAGPSEGATVSTLPVDFTWAGSDDQTAPENLLFSYKIDDGNWTDYAAVTSASFTDLAGGSHTFYVKAKDEAGNEEITPVLRTFWVDLAPPDTQITSGPAEGARVCDASVTFGSTGSDDTTDTNALEYAWRLDDGTWSEFGASAPITLASLTNGQHTFEVRARDLLGNTDPTPARVSFHVDLTAPAISSVSAIPGEGQCTITWITDDPATSQVEYGTSSTYGSSSPMNASAVTSHSVVLTGLAIGGTYHFRVKSTDACGRESISSDSVFYTLPDVFHDITWDANADFPRASNPQGAWSTGWYRSFTELLHLYPTQPGPGPGWYDPAIAVSGTPAFWRNEDVYRHWGVGPGQISLHPGQNEYSLVRWTAPFDHAYTVRAKFYAGDWGETDGYVLVNGAAIFTAETTSSEPSFEDTVVLNGGDYIDFAVGNKGNFVADNTPLDARVSTTTADNAGPDTAIVSGPGAGQKLCVGEATFAFIGSDDTTPSQYMQYKWRVDAGEWSDFSLATTQLVTGLTEGNHTFEVATKDAFDKVDPTPATRHFAVDLTPPAISSVTSNPSQLQATVSWITDEDSTSQVEYGLTSEFGQLSPLDSRMSVVHNVLVSGLTANSTYYYRVKSRDACGRETVSAGGTFATSPDASAPETQIISGPGEGAKICDASAAFGFTGSDDTTHATQLRYQWRIDGGAWSSPSTATTAAVSNLTHGSHTFEVAAKDLVDKVDATPATRHFCVDLNIPVISAVAGSPSHAQLTISWTTDEPSSSQVDYGQSDTYGSSTPFNSQPVTSHSVTITGLAPDTTYHFRVRSKDSCNRESVSDDALVKTLVDDGSPETEITSGPSEGGIACSTTVNLCWSGSDTATPKDQLIYSWKIDSAGWSDYTPDTCRTFTGLSEGSHIFYARAKDPSGNVDVTPAVRHFTVDLSSPTVSNVRAVGQSVQAIITWQTTKPATSLVEYGATSGYGSSTQISSQLVTSHSVNITGLTPEKTYHFRVKSRDACDREAVSGDASFATTADSDAPNTLIASGPAEGAKSCTTDVRICWSANDNATPAVEMVYQYKLDADEWSGWSADTCRDFANLADGVHTLSMRAKDTAGNIDGTPAVRAFVVDTASPAISNVSLSPRVSSVTVSWITNEPTNSQVEYGPTDAYGTQTYVDSNMVTSHKVTVSGLTSETTYHMRVRSSDGCLEAVSDDQSVTTSAIIPPNLQPLSLQTPLSTSAQQEMQVTWTVRNAEPGDAAAGWLDAFYLSDDEALDELDVPLGAFMRGSGLSGMFAYNVTQNLTMPMAAPGLHYLILKVDQGNAISEMNENDNVFIHAINFTMPRQLVLSPGQVWLRLHPGTPVSGQIDVSNMGITALSGLSASVDGASANINVQVNSPGAIDRLSAGKISYTITASDESVLQSTPTLRISSAEGPDASVVLNLLVVPRQPQVVANPGRLDAGMVRGKQATIECEIANNGGVPANDLRVAIPDVPWLGLVSPQQIGTLAPGEKTRVSLLLKPSSTLALGPYTGNLAVAGSNGGVSVPFRFNALSDGRGGLKVIAMDEFTFFAADKPNVTDATVILTDAVDGHVIFEAMTDENGVVLRENIPEGHYNLEVRAYKHSTDHEPVEIVAGEVKEIQAFMRRQMVTYTWNVEPVQIEDKYRITLEAVFETHVPAPVVTVDPPYKLVPVLEGITTEIDYTITNHGLIAAQGVRIDFGESADFYIVPLIRDIGTLAPMSSIVVPVLVRAKSDGPILLLPGVAQNSPAAKAMMDEASGASLAPGTVRAVADGGGGDDPMKPCDLTIEGQVFSYHKCGDNNVPVTTPIDTTPLKIGKEVYDIISCGFDLMACAGGLATAETGAGAIIAADKCPDAIRCLFKYSCAIISHYSGLPCCFCKLVSSILGDTGEMGDAFMCLPMPKLGNSRPRVLVDGDGWGVGVDVNLPDNGFPVDVTPWNFGSGVPGPCAGMPPISWSPSSSATQSTASGPPGAAAAKSKSDISKYGGKEVRYQIRCY